MLSFTARRMIGFDQVSLATLQSFNEGLEDFWPYFGIQMTGKHYITPNT